MYKSGSGTIGTTTISGKMAAQAPAEIGTRGTVGSLLMKEIEYFSQLEPNCQSNSQKPESHNIKEKESVNCNSRPVTESVITPQKKKKKRGNRLPGMCSMVEVSDNSWSIGVSRSNYRSLKSDVKKLQA